MPSLVSLSPCGAASQAAAGSQPALLGKAACEAAAGHGPNAAYFFLL
jgi:hypothetical protein